MALFPPLGQLGSQLLEPRPQGRHGSVELCLVHVTQSGALGLEGGQG